MTEVTPEQLLVGDDIVEWSWSGHGGWGWEPCMGGGVVRSLDEGKVRTDNSHYLCGTRHSNLRLRVRRTEYANPESAARLRSMLERLIRRDP